jgi:anti-sigma regulatory factor (Ser/Thr protein kinase)
MENVLLQQDFIAAPEQLKLIRELVRNTAAYSGLRAEQIDQVVMSVNEACMNIIQHAYHDQPGRIGLHISTQQNSFVVQLTDDAAPLDPALIKPRPLDELRPGGLGVHFMQQAMDVVTYQAAPVGNGNILIMKKYLSNLESK